MSEANVGGGYVVSGTLLSITTTMFSLLMIKTIKELETIDQITCAKIFF